MFFANANFGDPQDRHLLAKPIVIFGELRVRMRIGRSHERNSFFHREPNDFVARIKFVDRFAPARGGKFDAQIARPNKIEGLIHDRSNIAARAMAMDFDKIEMRQAINQTRCGDLANTAKVVFINFVDVAPNKLFRAVGHAVEHLLRIVQVMNRAENEVEFVPIFLDPLSARARSLRIVIELDPGANFHIRIDGAKFIDLIEVNAGMVTIVVGERDVVQAARTRAVDPGLQQFLGIWLNAVSLRMRVVIGEELMVDR